MNRNLRQARKMFTDNINENPTSIIISRAPLVSDGVGGLIPDPYGTGAVPVTVKCRISHESAAPAEDQSNPAGMSTNLSRMIQSDRNNLIQKDEYFTVDGLGSFQIGPVDPLYKFEGLIGYQAPLIEA